MEIGTRVKEQSQMGATIKTEEDTAATSTAYIDIEIDLNHLKQEPGLVQFVESASAMFEKKENVENSSEDDSDQQCAQSASTPAGAGSLYEANSMSQGDWINVKRELEEIEIGPTVLQHMDIHYALNKSAVDGCNIAMQCSGVKKNVEDRLRDSLTPQEPLKKKWFPVLQSYRHGVQEPNLAACSVHVMRMNVFQCDLCHSVYADKRKLLLHLQAVHACLLQTFNVKFRKTNNQTAADNKATSYNCCQMTTEADYYETSLKSHLAQQNYMQKHLHGQRTTSSNDVKCDSDLRDLNFQKHLRLKIELKNHLVNYESHTKTKSYYRDEKFTQCEDLSTHRVYTDEKPFQCKICDTKFTQKSNLSKHIRIIHKNEKHFQCKICDAKFAQKSKLTKHVSIHKDEKPFQCKICDAGFALNSNLTRHMRIHTGEKPFLCKICGARFARTSALTMHMRLHTGEKPYQCETCDAIFARRSVLTKHLRVHTGEKPFRCKICDARFTQSSSLSQHMRVHTGEKPFQCKICNAKFAFRKRLFRHTRVHTGK